MYHHALGRRQVPFRILNRIPTATTWSTAHDQFPPVVDLQSAGIGREISLELVPSRRSRMALIAVRQRLEGGFINIRRFWAGYRVFAR